MTHTESVIRTIEYLRRQLASGTFDAAELRDIEAGIALLVAELADEQAKETTHE